MHNHIFGGIGRLDKDIEKGIDRLWLKYACGFLIDEKDMFGSSDDYVIMIDKKIWTAMRTGEK